MRRYLKAALYALMTATLLGAAFPAVAQVAADFERARALRVLGTELTPALAKGTAAIFGPLTAKQSAEGVTIARDLAYGPHERHRLDVFSPAGARNAPVMIYLHGGGFVRGDKGNVANIGIWFACRGVVAVTMNYRLAPEVQWPSGARDVAAALERVAAFPGFEDRLVERLDRGPVREPGGRCPPQALGHRALAAAHRQANTPGAGDAAQQA